MPDNKNALPLGTILNTRYEIEGLVGGGGFGLVYRARHLKLNSIVAIKELFLGDIVVRQDKAVHPISDDKVALYQKVLSGFRKEGQRLARLGNCLSIVRCHDYFEENGTGYLVMEYVEGKSLRELVRTYRKAGKSFSEDALISLVRKLLAGLKEVHKAGIQHMDIKPENIYLRQTDDLGELSNPVLLDFGAARSQTGHSTGSSLLVGTVPYAPLEQMYEGGVIGPWTDIYALGITLYELVFEKANIPGSTERLAEFHSKGIDPLEAAKSKGKSGYSEKFLRLIDKSIEIKAADRPQSVEELEEKLSLKSEQKLPESDERFRVSKTFRQPFTFKESYKGIAILISISILVMIVSYISKPDTNKVGDTGSEEIEHPPKSGNKEETPKQVGDERGEGIDYAPIFIVENYWHNYGKDETQLDLESYKDAVLQDGSKQLIDEMSQRLYSTIYEQQGISREDFDERSGYNEWKEAMRKPDTDKGRGISSEEIRHNSKSENKEEALKQVGDTFRDCATCPEMVVVPSGSFMMGSPASEQGRYDSEGPQHQVSIQSFAVGKYEVTRGQFAVFVAATGYDAGNCYILENLNWRSLNFEQNDDHPVVCVSWEDAQAYVKWLSEKTGEQYRLLSEAEWEYVARAGTTTLYHFGTTISRSQANYGSNNGGTVEVGSYPANAFGLHDMHGNAGEWVADCVHGSYNGAPTDGSAWTSGCDHDIYLRVLRGGSWYFKPRDLRSANRIDLNASYRNYFIGFRIARTLTS